MDLTDYELFYLAWVYVCRETWWAIGRGPDYGERLRERDLIERYEVRYPTRRGDDIQVRYKITQRGNDFLCEVETSRIVTLCVKRSECSVSQHRLVVLILRVIMLWVGLLKKANSPQKRVTFSCTPHYSWV